MVDRRCVSATRKLLELRWVDCLQPEGAVLSSSWNDEGEIEPIDEGTLAEEQAPGPVVLPVSPVMGYAMRVVLAEYEYEPILQEHAQENDDDEVADEEDRRTERGDSHSRRGYRSSGMSDEKSDYVSLSDVEEY